MTMKGGGLIWFTGLSGAGKTTLATAFGERLRNRGVRLIQLDGDRLRQGLCADLGFSEVDRRENLRRAGEVARLLVDEGLLVVASFISPYQADRARIRSLFAPGRFAEIHVHCPVEICEARDPKGLYAFARKERLPHFTGITDPYEVPEYPDLRLDTHVEPLEACLRRLDAWLEAWQAPLSCTPVEPR